MKGYLIGYTLLRKFPEIVESTNIEKWSGWNRTNRTGGYGPANLSKTDGRWSGMSLWTNSTREFSLVSLSTTQICFNRLECRVFSLHICSRDWYHQKTFLGCSKCWERIWNWQPLKSQWHWLQYSLDLHLPISFSIVLVPLHRMNLGFLKPIA